MTKKQNKSENEDDDNSTDNSNDLGDMFPSAGISERDEEDTPTQELVDSLLSDPTLTKKRKHVNEGSQSQKPRKKKKVSNDYRLYKPPTVEEMNELRETENLFNSNLFRLQIDEMLKEIEIKQKHKTQFQSWFEQLKTCLCKVDCSKEHDLTKLKWLKRIKVKMPVNIKQSMISKGTFRFVPPSSVTLVGSYSLNCCLGPHFSVNIQIEMPQKCFMKSDHMNHRYHIKKALYLCYLSWIIQENDLSTKLQFSYVEGDPLRPVLKVTPTGSIGKHCTVVLHAIPQEGIFKLSRFSPEKNNIRPSWFFNDVNKNEDYLPPTPHHNNGVLCDMVLIENSNYLKETIKNHQCLLDGIRLLRVWLRQRQLDTGLGSFNGFVMSMLVVYLVRSRRVSTLGSSYQVARCTWSYLSQCNWLENGLSFLDESSSDISLSEFHRHFDVVFVDVTGYCNLCANMSKETFLKVKREADAAVKSLDNPNINSFEPLFMMPMTPYRQYDHIIRLTNVDLKHSDEEQLDYGYNLYPLTLRKILEVLQRGLSQRVFAIDIITSNTTSWPVSQAPPEYHQPVISLGLLLNPVFAFSILDKGPSANTEEAEDFRNFWGSKSELRRFQDGSICEAVLWTADTMAEKRLICKQVVEYLLTNKLEISPSCISYLADQLELLIQQNKIGSSLGKYGTGEEASLAVIRAFDELSRKIRQLQDMPLDISVVQGISPVFRYCETFPPFSASVPLANKGSTHNTSCLINRKKVNDKTPRWIPAVEATVQLGLSKKWPDNLDALRRVKAAFYMEIAKGLKEQFSITSQPFTEHLDVLMSGFVYRLHISHQGEVALLKRQVSSLGVTEYRNTEESVTLEKLITHLPAITGSLHGLHQQHPSFGPAVCVSKRWFSAQLLDDFHFPEICIELLVAWLYLYPEPFVPPGQPQVAFLRLLHKLSTTDWSIEPLILNFNDEMTRQEVLEIQTNFQNSRTSLPPLFVATPQQRSGTVWTHPAPTLQILLRIAQLASESLHILESEMLYDTLDPKLVFRPPLDIYDVVIRLKASANPRRYEAVDNESCSNVLLPKYVCKKGERIPIVSFDPVRCYIEELRDTFGEFALFFYDMYGGNVITVLWIPDSKEERDFKISRVNCRKLTRKGSRLTLNIEAILEDFLILGKGLVESIHRQT